MTITLNREQIVKASALASLATEQRPVIPIWDCIYFKSTGGNLYIYGKGESNQIRVFQKIEHTDDFEFVIPAKMFVETIRNIKSELIELTIEKNKTSNSVIVNAVGRKSKFTIASFNPTDFSVDLEEEEKHSFTVPARTFLSVIKNCSAFPNEKDIRLPFQGISMRNFKDKIEVCGTSGAIVARFLMDVDAEISPVIMQKNIASSILVFPNEGDITVRTTDKSVVIDNGSIQLISRIIAAKFPEIDPFWVNEFNSENYVTVSKQELQDTFKLLKNFTTNEYFSVKFTISGQEVICRAETYEKTSSGEHGISCDNFNTEDVYVGININFLEKIVNAIESDNLNLHIKAKDKSVFVTEVNNSLHKSFIVMPVVI
jgi:DNA polymerase III sliding clamp (beta) subunit (PCNA family)